MSVFLNNFWWILSCSIQRSKIPFTVSACIDACICRPSNRRYHGVDGMLGWKYGKYNFGEMASWDILCRCLQAIHQPNEDKLWTTQHKIKTPEPNIAIFTILFFWCFVCVIFSAYYGRKCKRRCNNGSSTDLKVLESIFLSHHTMHSHRLIRVVWPLNTEHNK